MDGEDFQDRATLNTAEINNSKESQPIPFTKLKIIKNLVVVCIGLLLLFIAYNGLSMLQSTMNQNQGIGVVSQAIIYAGFCISALLLPKYTIKKLGCKNTLLFSMVLYIPYIAANFYFNWITMVPSAILVGLAASLLWSSQCTYFNEAAVIYSTLLTGESCDKKMKLNNQVSSDLIQKRSQVNTKTKTLYENLDCKTLFVNNSNDEGIRSPFRLQPEYYYRNSEQESVEKIMPNTYISDTNAQGQSELDMFYSENSSLNDITPKFQNDNMIIPNASVDIAESIASVSTSKYPNNCSKNTLNAESLNNKTQKVALSKQLSKLQAEEYSKIISSVTARFFGFFGLVFRTSDIWSNLMSYYVLHDENDLDNITENGNCSCGAAFCNVESECFEHNLAEPSQQMRNILTGVSVILGVLAILLIWLCLDELQTNRKPISFSFSLAMATCKFSTKKEALLLLPLSAYIGLQQGFYIGDFTKSFIACSWGVYHVGLVTIAYGVSAGLSSTLAGFMVKYMGRTPVMVTGALVNAGVNVFLLVWSPHPDQPLLIFLAASMWGVAVGILWSQLRAFYGVIFKKDEEAAFAGFYLWDSIGYCLSFSYSNYICTYIKIYILLAVSSLGIVGYLRTESMSTDQIKE